MAEKDYYAILGVLSSIEQAALTAVYKALMKKYHPEILISMKSKTNDIKKYFYFLRNKEPLLRIMLKILIK